MNDVMRIAAVVFNSPRPRPREPRSHGGLGRGRGAQGARIVCFPELNITGYGTDAGVRTQAEPVPGPAQRSACGAMAARHGLVILAGLAEQAGRRPDLREPPGRRTGRRSSAGTASCTSPPPSSRCFRPATACPFSRRAESDSEFSSATTPTFPSFRPAWRSTGPT